MGEALLDEHAIGKLRWRCRRGMLENDLLIERFFARHGTALTPRQGAVLEELMQLSDNELMDLLLRRREPSGELDRSEVRDMLELLRTRPAAND
ncbi:succinate dehydrogenase assembly factor 2 [Ramlibacter sp.]|uniref:FAD assembly factor SdhE n=1 Tax=Ramlibacter sp. TaxID=1917967 RepID=UPI002D6449BD|nr:succinate dehydrogenase assembly factor 2 [Ramlibacter sp.]HYD74779.1 succinate dehydrogenase assembly factor 2 [Ramlibacter sp.]